MKLEIDIPEHHYNNIMAIDSINLGRAPYKGIIMYAINAIKHGKVLEQEPFKPMVEIDLYSVIKQKYIEREVLDKIRAEIKHFMYDVNPSSSESDYACNYILQILDKYKAETEADNE